MAIGEAVNNDKKLITMVLNGAKCGNSTQVLGAQKLKVLCHGI